VKKISLERADIVTMFSFSVWEFGVFLHLFRSSCSFSNVLSRVFNVAIIQLWLVMFFRKFVHSFEAISFFVSTALAASHKFWYFVLHWYETLKNFPWDLFFGLRVIYETNVLSTVLRRHIQGLFQCELISFSVLGNILGSLLIDVWFCSWVSGLCKSTHCFWILIWKRSHIWQSHLQRIVHFCSYCQDFGRHLNRLYPLRFFSFGSLIKPSHPSSKDFTLRLAV
jgi:hypothetical protein